MCLNVFKIIEWVLYLILFLNSIYFAWEVLDRFNSQDQGIRQRKEMIRYHPTIVICPNPIYEFEYWNDFNITYTALRGGSCAGQLET